MEPNQKQPRMADERYLAFVRTCMCSGCGVFPPCDAAHIRMASAEHGKRSVGMGEKPDDRWAVPLCRSCHARQHSQSEDAFWKALNRDPFKIAIQLYRLGGTKETVRKRKKAKMKSRPFPKTKRKFGR